MIVAVKSEYLSKKKVEDDVKSSHDETTGTDVRYIGFIVHTKYFITIFV